MDIVVNGRNSEISERFRQHVHDKLSRIDKYDGRQRIQRVEVEVTHATNPRQHDKAARVEMTLRSAGPVVRAEAASTDQHSALDAAIDKLESRLRRSNDRQRIHHGQRHPRSVAEATAGLPVDGLAVGGPAVDGLGAEPSSNGTATAVADLPIEAEGDCPVVVRQKTHAGTPMTLDQALYEMELVGHDFFLFIDSETMRPSVVYLRRGYDYGVIHLDVTP